MLDFGQGYLIVSAIAALLAAVFLAARLSPAFRFWIFHAYVNFPLVGQISRSAMMRKRRVDIANERLDKLFSQYRPLIGSQKPKPFFENAAEYVHLAGDAGTSPTSGPMKLFLFILLMAEAFAFSFLLTTAIWAQSTENQGFYWSFVIAAILAIALAIAGHFAGRSLRRAQTLSSAAVEAIDESAPLPEGEEKSLVDLTRRVRLDEDQSRDQGTSQAFGSQRQLNRIRKMDNEAPNFKFAALYWLAMLLLAGAIFIIRDADNAVSAAGRAVTDGFNQLLAQLGADTVTNAPSASPILEAAQNRVVWWANFILSFIFLLTQAIVFGIAHRNALMGRESKKALGRLGGYDAYEDYAAAYDEKVLKADDSLKNLLAQLKNRYGMSPNPALYRARLRDALAKEQAQDAAPPSPPPPAPESPTGETKNNVIQPEFRGTAK